MNIIAVGTSWESLLVFLGLILVSAISNWLKQKRQGNQTDSWPEQTESPKRPQARRPSATMPPGPAAPRPQPKRPSWEDELRRLLGEEQEQPPPPPRPPFRPVIQILPPPKPATPPATPPQIPKSLDRTSSQESPNLELSTRKLELARMAESKQAYQTGQQLPQQVAGLLQEVDVEVARHPRAIRRAVPREAARALHMLRDPSSARQAFIVSLVFGPPKALEERQS
jgi:hypothetical protein